MAKWQLQEAKARFSEFVDAAVKKGPQIVTRRGVETAILVPMEEWHRLQAASRPSLKSWLMSPEPRFDDLVPERGRMRHRPTPEFE